MSHYAESALCQKLQNRRFIPKRCLDANILGLTNAKELEKSFLSSTNKLLAIDLFILFTAIPNFNFWYFNVLIVSFVVFASYTVDDKTI